MIKLILSILLRIFRNIIFHHRRNNNILVINNGKIGDLICSTPFYRSLKNSGNDFNITLMAGKDMAHVLRDNPDIDQIITKDSIIDLTRHFDICFVLSPSTNALHLANKLLPRKVFSICPNYGKSSIRASKLSSDHYIEYRHDKTVLETYLELLTLIGINSGSTQKHFHQTPCSYPQPASRISFSISISTGNNLKEWDAKQIRDLLLIISQTIETPTFYLLGSSEDIIKGEEISTELPNTYNLCGKYSLSETAHIIGNSSLFMGFDSALTYIADSINTPIIYISGPTDFIEQRPMGLNVRIIYNPDLPCRPCSFVYKTNRKCTNAIDKECLKSLDYQLIAEECKSLVSLNLKQ